MSFLAGEFNRLRNGQATMTKPKPKSTHNPHNLYQILSSEALLSHPKRQILLRKIKKESNIEEPYFSAFYHTLITRFAEFVQAIPAQTGGKLGGLMDNGLERALFAVQFTNSNPDPLRKYAFFSAGLLVDVGRVMGLQKVMLSDAEGTFIAEWYPLAGSMVGQAEHYKIRPLGDQWMTLNEQVTPFFARYLLPEDAFKWLSDDYAIFQMWLATLLGDGVHGGEIADFLLQAREREKALELKREYDGGGGAQALPALDVPTTQPPEVALGEDFLAFLQDGFEQGNISPEDLQLLNTGELFVDARLVQHFNELHGSAVELGRLIGNLKALGFHKLSGTDVRFEQFFAPIADRPIKPALPFFNANAPAQPFTPGMHVHLGMGNAAVREGLRLQRPEAIIRKMQALNKAEFQANATPAPRQAPSPAMPEQGVKPGLWGGGNK